MQIGRQIARAVLATLVFLLGLALGPTAAPAQAGWLPAGTNLLAGQSITSPDGRYRLVMQGDGNLVQYGPAGAVWWTGTWGSGRMLSMQADGNLVVYGAGKPLWATGTWGHEGSGLALQDDGNVVVRLGARALWSTATGPLFHTLAAGETLRPGEQRFSLDHRTRLIMQDDGNLVQYGPAGALWATMTGVPGSVATMRGDGNLVVYGGGAARWYSRTVAGPDSRLVVQDDGNAVLLSGGTVRWSALTGLYMADPTTRGLDAATRARMTPGTWRPGCPVGLDALVLLELPYRDYGGWGRRGALIVHRDVAGSLGWVMTSAARSGFLVHRIDVADVTGGSDAELMRLNITSAFNCRYVAGTTRWSNHAYGRAIDVNPLVNPWVSANGRVSPPEGAPYANRSVVAPGMVYAGQAPVTTFAAAGWQWGGNWVGDKDYQHFDR